MNQIDLKGRVAVITGGAQGIGYAVAERMLNSGAEVVLWDIDAARLAEAENALAKLGRLGKVTTSIVELTMAADIDAATADAARAHGRIDILVNNAGALWWMPVADTPMKRFDLVMGVNARASFACTQACMPHMLTSGGGHVIVYSPPIDLKALPNKVAYCISKFGMTMLAMGLAQEMQGKPFSINAIWPVTAVESYATINFQLGGPAFWRKPAILADATLAIVSKPPGAITGQALFDEDVLRAEGVTDFVPYRCDPNSEPPRIGIDGIPQVGLAPPRA